MNNLKMVEMVKVSDLKTDEGLWEVSILDTRMYLSTEELICVWSEIKNRLDKEFNLKEGT